MTHAPVLVEFIADTQLYREPAVVPKLPIVGNGPPGTFVIFGDGRKVSLPTDQIVFADDVGIGARVGFGGMSFAGIEDGYLVFHRVRELSPEAQLSPERSRRMTLAPHMVATVYVDGREVWPLCS